MANRTDLTRMKRLNDDLVRKIIRLRDDWTCQRCGIHCKETGEVAHVEIRKYINTRWDLLNLLLLCNKCHSWFDQNRVAGMRWFEETFPVRADHLADIKRDETYRRMVYRVSDYKEINTALKAKLKELCDEAD
ncbi:MAG: hypothetical protein PHF37_09995 [Phycisphaerae bacterium]|nr:hypothetical protein [Phycisphaerae bacterium]